MVRRRLLALVIAATALAGCAGGSGTSPPAADTAATTADRSPALSCGAQIEQSVTLTADLSCPDGIALTVVAAGVTVDLNGHTLTGPGPGRRRWPLPDFDLAGVSVRADNVIVANGTLRGFGIGVVVEDATGVTIENVTTIGDYYGVYLYGGGQHHIEGNQIVENVYGLHLEQTQSNTVIANELSRQTHHSPGGYGIYLHAASENLIERNWIRDNLNWGIWLSDSTGNTLVRNNVSNNHLTQVSDDTGGNQWFDEELREGNYWGDYVGGDDNGDGIGDLPYNIGGPGRSLDLYPFVQADGWANRSGPTADLPTPEPVPPSPPRAYVELADGSLTVVDLDEQELVDTWQFEPGTGALALSLDGTTLYLAAGTGAAAEVLAVDTAGGQVVERFSVPGVYRIAAMYDDRALIVAGSAGLAELVLATGAMNALPGSSPGSQDVVAITPSWKHNLAFVTVRSEVSVVYLPDRHAPYGAELPNHATFAVDNRSGTRLFVSVLDVDEIVVLDTENFETTDALPLGGVDPRDARFMPSPDGSTLYLLDTAASRLSALDLATQQVTASVVVSGAATALGVSGDGEFVVVAAEDGAAGRLVVFNPALQPLHSFDLPAPPIGLALPR